VRGACSRFSARSNEQSKAPASRAHSKRFAIDLNVCINFFSYSVVPRKKFIRFVVLRICGLSWFMAGCQLGVVRLSACSSLPVDGPYKPEHYRYQANPKCGSTKPVRFLLRGFCFSEFCPAFTIFLMRVVFDTSVLVAAMRSQQGASYALVKSIPAPQFQLCLSVGLYTEWQDVLTRPEHLVPGRTPENALAFMRYLASHAHLQEIHFLWRPFLVDPDDDLVLELAFAANCRHIVTHNVRDFDGSEQLGITAVTPREFMKMIMPNT